jgi:hypothetical protein
VVVDFNGVVTASRLTLLQRGFNPGILSSAIPPFGASGRATVPVEPSVIMSNHVDTSSCDTARLIFVRQKRGNLLLLNKLILLPSTYKRLHHLHRVRRDGLEEKNAKGPFLSGTPWQENEYELEYSLDQVTVPPRFIGGISAPPSITPS